MGMLKCPTTARTHHPVLRRHRRPRRRAYAKKAICGRERVVRGCRVRGIRAVGERRCSFPGEIGFDHLLPSPLDPFCYECLRDRFASLGEDDLTEAIARDRARHLK
jgi:hypothetical protein